ncbi:hypothetical protein [Roseivivax halodurans]|nr:hypothetical protein [Roseivivax halodurans]
MAQLPEPQAAQDPVKWWSRSISAAPPMTLLETWMDVFSEVQSFLAERIRADVATQHALLHCTNPVDAQVIGLRHLHKLAEDYHRGAGRVTSLLHAVPGAASVLDE